MRGMDTEQDCPEDRRPPAPGERQDEGIDEHDVEGMQGDVVEVEERAAPASGHPVLHGVGEEV